MITISFAIPSVSPELILALAVVLAPLLLMGAFWFASGAASAVRQMTK